MAKGQVSTELLVIVALVLLIFIPLLVMVYFKANDTNQQIASYQAELAVFRVAYLANSVGSLGTSSSMYTDIYVPKSVRSFSTAATGQGGEIKMQVDTPSGPSDIVEVVRYPITGAGTIVSAPNTGVWVRLNVSSEYTSGGVARVKVTKVAN